MKQTFLFAALFALAACQQGSDDNFAIDETNSLGADVETLPADESSLNNVAGGGVDRNQAANPGAEQPSPPDGAPADMIPAQYRGRWGMTVNDCDRSRSDAKGAMTVAERTISFYESRATLKERRPATATSFSGLFAFTGEGQNWEKVMTFTRTGDTLKRTEEGGTFTYQRCA